MLIARENGMVRSACHRDDQSEAMEAGVRGVEAATSAAESAGGISGMNLPSRPQPPNRHSTKAGPHHVQKIWIRRDLSMSLRRSGEVVVVLGVHVAKRGDRLRQGRR
jgi:hypothetical protein